MEVSQEGDKLAFIKNDAKLEYAGLRALDAQGISLSAQMRPVNGGFEIRVDDAHAIYPVTVDPVLTQQGYLTDSGALEFGSSLSISSDGNTALIGAVESGTNYHEGAAFVFTRSGGSWTEQAELSEPTSGPNAGAALDLFGFRVSLSADGTRALIAVPGRHTGAIVTGEALLYTRSGTVWTQSASFSVPGVQGFGPQVSLSADGKTVMAIQDEPIAYVFGQSPTTGVWSLQATLTASGINQGIAAGVATMSGDASTIMMSMGSNMYVFAGHGTTWTQQQVLTISSSSVSLSTDGNTALIGNGFESGSGTDYDIGAAYVFARSAGVWTQRARLTAPTIGLGAAAPYDYFGYSVALSPEEQSQ